MPSSVIVALASSYIAESIAAAVITDAFIASASWITYAGATAAIQAGVGYALTSAISGGGGDAAPPQTSTSGFTTQVKQRSYVVRSNVENRRIVYGKAMVSGPLVFAASTNSNNTLHLVVAIAGHEIEEIGDIYFNDEKLGALDGDGDVTDGRFSGYVTIKKYLGTATQTADPDLVAANVGWTTDHRLQGVAYLYLRLTYNRNTFPRGIPNIKAVIKGKKVYDPRSATTVWSDNPALVIRDYLTASFGLACASAEIDDAAFIAAANLCDELVDITEQMVNVTYAATVKDGGSNGEAYNAVMSMFPPSVFTLEAFNFGALAAQAVADAAGSIQAQIDAAKTEIVTRGGELAEKRYTANGVLDTGATPRDNLQTLLTACGGVLVWTAGKYVLHGAAYTAPAVTLTEDDLRGKLTVRPRQPRQRLFNAVRGTYVGPDKYWQPGDFTPVTNATYAAQDGAVIWRDLALPMTTSAATAQRLGKILLETGRQAISVEFPAKAVGFKLAVWDTVRLTIASLGWSAKEFKVVSWEMAESGGVNLTLQEESAACYAWSAEETIADPAPDTNLPDPYTVAAPGVPSVSEALYETRESAGVKVRVTFIAADSAGPYVDAYQFEYRAVGATDWTVLPRVATPELMLFDFAPGRYDVRVKAINTLGVSSAYATRSNVEVLGLAIPPAAVSGLSLQAAGGLAIITFDLHPDLDVRIGGKVRVRHSAALTGATWETSVSIGEAVPGNTTVAVLPLKEGTYLVKAEDSTGNLSLTATTISTKQASALTWSPLTSVQEDDDFLGTHTDTVVDDVSGINYLQLESIGTIDVQPDFDAIDNLAAIGGIQPSGTYDFAAGMDLGSVQRVRLTTTIVAQIINALDQLDSRAGDIDTWQDFDGTTGAAADAWVEVRETDDNPAGSPTWSTWRRLDAAEFQARAFDFRARLTTSDPAYNIQISQLRVAAATIA